MAKTLDFNKFARPTWKVVLPGENAPVVLTTPTYELVDELDQMSKQMAEFGENNIQEMYELAAKLLSYNTKKRKFCADQLAKNYRLGLEGLIAFFEGYTEFLVEAANSKN